MKNKILTIGPVTKDYIISPYDKYYQIGGAVYYQTMTLMQLKKDVISIISIGRDDVEILDDALKNQKLILQEKTLEYTNIYDKNLNRTQKAGFHENIIDIKDIESNLTTVKYAIISPLTPQDISPETISYIRKNNITTVLVAQGYLRTTDDNGNVIEREWTDREKYLKNTDILCLDENEALLAFQTNELKEKIFKNALNEYEIEQIIITQAENGSTIYTKEKTYKIPAIKTDKIIDATGLGDTYIAAYIAKLDETNDTYTSGIYAAITAKEKLKTKGPIKTSKKVIEEELNEYRQSNKWNSHGKNK